jgi:cytochrome c553
MKKVVLALMVAGAVSLVSADGKAAFAKCAGCHGQDGKKKALNKSAVIAGQDAAKTVEQLKGYKAGTLNTHGMGALMKGQVSSMSDADMKAVADYIAGLK